MKKTIKTRTGTATKIKIKANFDTYSFENMQGLYFQPGHSFKSNIKWLTIRNSEREMYANCNAEYRARIDNSTVPLRIKSCTCTQSRVEHTKCMRLTCNSIAEISTNLIWSLCSALHWAWFGYIYTLSPSAELLSMRQVSSRQSG